MHRTMKSVEHKEQETEYERQRLVMVREQLEARGIRDPRVLEAMRRIPRHRFLPEAAGNPAVAYEDRAQPIEERQTISQPFIVGLMTESLTLTGDEKVLEIGAGSGYQTAILAALCREVIAIERHARLAARARGALESLGIANVRLLVGDGSRGVPEEAPYDAILVAAVAPQVPPALVEQLAPGGRLILPVGPESAPQHLLLLTKDAGGAVSTRDLGEVAFVPLIGASGYGLPDDLGHADF